jgi:hypothetical protein
MASRDRKNSIDAQWSDIEKTLPPMADRAQVRNRLEQIAWVKPSPEAQAIQCEEIARQCDELAARMLPARQVAFIEQLRQSGDAWKKLAARYRQVGKIDRPRFVLQCELLYLWESIGGDLKITTPRRTKIWRALRDTTKSPPPRGPVIAYFQAAGKAVLDPRELAPNYRAVAARAFDRH